MNKCYGTLYYKTTELSFNKTNCIEFLNLDLVFSNLKSLGSLFQQSLPTKDIENLP